jgi:GTP cyclohydrolase II
MGLANGGPARHLSIALGTDATPESINRIATAMRATGQLAARPATGTEAAGLALARTGQLIPAVVSVCPDTMRLARLLEWLSDDTVLDVSGAEIEAVVSKAGIEVTHVVAANVPLEDAETAQFVFFREGNGFVQHVAILIGERAQWPDPVPVRVHSACLTGDIFGSLRCDCGEQLHGCLRYFAEQGGGVLVYLAQEGRGIGLGNKIRAYALQDRGRDTVQANLDLGFKEDLRDYGIAAQILRELGVSRVRLLTNNPRKIAGLQRYGVQVVERIALESTPHDDNIEYLRTKREKLGHFFSTLPLLT